MTANLLDSLNPLTRLVMAILVSIPALLSLDYVSASTLFAAMIVIFLICQVRPIELYTRCIPLLLVAPIGAISMLLYGRSGGTVYFTFGIMTISSQSIDMAIAVFLRILVLGMAAVIILGGANATHMADGLAQLAHLPARFVLGVLAGVRMVGLFTDDWRTMTLARRARGLGDTGRLRRFMTMSFALLVFAIRRGSKLATTMEARGFGSNTPRTWARASRLSWADLVGVTITIGVGIVAVWLAIYTDHFFIVWR